MSSKLNRRSRKSGGALSEQLEPSVLYTLIGFCVIVVAMILIGAYVLHTPIVAICVLVIINAAIAGLLHRTELWLHAVLIICEVIAGALTGRIIVVLLCIVVYVAGIVMLEISDKQKSNS